MIEAISIVGTLLPGRRQTTISGWIFLGQKELQDLIQCVWVFRVRYRVPTLCFREESREAQEVGYFVPTSP